MHINSPRIKIELEKQSYESQSLVCLRTWFSLITSMGNDSLIHWPFNSAQTLCAVFTSALDSMHILQMSTNIKDNMEYMQHDYMLT